VSQRSSSLDVTCIDRLISHCSDGLLHPLGTETTLHIEGRIVSETSAVASISGLWRYRGRITTRERAMPA